MDASPGRSGVVREASTSVPDLLASFIDACVHRNGTAPAHRWSFLAGDDPEEE